MTILFGVLSALLCIALAFAVLALRGERKIREVLANELEKSNMDLLYAEKERDKEKRRRRRLQNRLRRTELDLSDSRRVQREMEAYHADCEASMQRTINRLSEKLNSGFLMPVYTPAESAPAA
jgi:biopolymer transport protein ExbB/TolQ